MTTTRAHQLQLLQYLSHQVVTSSVLRLVTVRLTAAHFCTAAFVSCHILNPQSGSYLEDLRTVTSFTDMQTVMTCNHDHHSEVSGSRHRFYWLRRLNNSSYFQRNLMASNWETCLTQSLPYNHFDYFSIYNHISVIRRYVTHAVETLLLNKGLRFILNLAFWKNLNNIGTVRVT